MITSPLQLSKKFPIIISRYLHVSLIKNNMVKKLPTYQNQGAIYTIYASIFSSSNAES